MPTDLLYIIHWWLILFIIGLFSFPITSFLLKSLFDKGYIFSKIIGIAIISYLILLFGAMHIVPFLQQTVVIFVILLGVVNTVFVSRFTDVLENLKQKRVWILFLFEEFIFFISLWFWAYIRGFKPDIHELEKFMDFGFVNSILRATYFPPKDMWFTPYSINYYYFGHFVTAVLTKLSGISSNITFNLMLATLFAFCFTCAFSFGINICSMFFKSVKAKMDLKQHISVILTGLLSAILLTFGGNLHVLYAFFKQYPNDSPVPIWQLPFLLSSFPNNYWYPNATRFIYHTIHEFPIYSFVVSDLHGHVLDIPFVLLTITFLLAQISKFEYRNSKQYQNTNAKNSKRFEHLNLGNSNLFRISDFGFSDLVFLGFLLAVMYMTNAWDGLIYFLLSAIVIGSILRFKSSLSIFTTAFIWEYLPLLSIILVCMFLFTLPFSLFFQPGSIAHGIGILCSPSFLTDKGKIGPFLFEANHCQHSPWWQLLILYGFFYFWAIPFLVLILKRFNFFLPQKNQKRKVESLSKSRNIPVSDLFVLFLILFSTLLIILPEFIYLKDIYPEHYRANTMFKFVYQAFMMLSLSAGYIIVRFMYNIKYLVSSIKIKILYTLYFIPGLFFIVMVVGFYPYFAITSYYGNLTSYQSLDGTKYLQSLYPSDYAAINWLNTNIHGQPVILEAQGDSYTDYARVSSNTGLPTVLGWTVHEWLWRGTYDVPAPRITDVQTLYETTDIATSVSLIEKYHIKYVFFGTLERQKYPNLDEAKFGKLGKIIYHNGTTTIYQLTI